MVIFFHVAVNTVTFLLAELIKNPDFKCKRPPLFFFALDNICSSDYQYNICSILHCRWSGLIKDVSMAIATPTVQLSDVMLFV